MYFKKHVASENANLESNFFELSDGDELVWEPKHENLNSTSHILNKQLNLNMEGQVDDNEPPGRIQEQQTSDFVKIKLESY
jgi:hypothetical protein